ncbi:hypothetical protein IW261DRAFT_1564374 [Armillaria novae-zelandiae]|uniref:Uncharacterized protein n=1 Tax=Armillaria novae-zelandiae TaxID=153914 RepID=A0AA39UAW2_9AGAR|nr:hypothetical protein IW261DRAFT_1564374 [Armillaria novae-zelandiae]
MSSPFSLPESHTQYQYFANFDPVTHYNAYCRVFNILMPGKHQMPQGTKEELAAMLRTAFQFLRPTLIALEGQHLIDSCVGAFIRGHLTRLHLELPANLRVVGWDGLIRWTSDEMRPSHCLSRFRLGSPLLGGQRFSVLNAPNPMEDYLLQQALPVVYRPPFLVPEENTAFPSVVFTRFPTPSPDDDEEDDKAESHSMTVADALSEPETALLFPEPPFPPPLLPDQPMPTMVSQPPASPMALPTVLTVEQASGLSTSVVLPSVASLLSSCRPDAPSVSSPLRASPMTAADFFLASPVQATPTRPNLCNLMEGHPASPPANTGFQELTRQMSRTVHPSSPHPAFPAAGSSRSFDFAAVTPTQFNPASLLRLPVPPRSASPLPPIEGQGDFNPLPVPTVIVTPSLPVIAVLEDSPVATPPVDELRSPSPPQMYHALSGDEPATLPPSPDVESEAEVEKVWATKKPKLSSFDVKPKKKSKAAPRKKARFMARSPGSSSDSETGGVSITQDTTRAELEALTFDDIWTAPHEFLLPVRYAGKNNTFSARSSANPWFAVQPHIHVSAHFLDFTTFRYYYGCNAPCLGIAHSQSSWWEEGTAGQRLEHGPTARRPPVLRTPDRCGIPMDVRDRLAMSGCVTGTWIEAGLGTNRGRICPCNRVGADATLVTL